MLKKIPTSLPDVCIFEPVIHVDARGSFFESFNQTDFEYALGQNVSFIQDNQSLSRQNVLRGLHYQLQTPQAKLVRVLQGEVFDVAVDLRQSSPSYGQWIGTILSAENKRQLWIPEGFAHGFLALRDNTEVLYKVSAPYKAEDERSIIWNDKTLNISWPLTSSPILSPKDMNAISFEMSDCFT